MKPSERIKELIIKNMDRFGSPDRIFQAIISYLDEEYERNKPCKCVTKGDTITNANCQVHYK